MAGAPSVLDLVRLSPDPVFPPGGEGLYRQIALLTELGPDDLLLDAACGRGIGTEFLATTSGAEGSSKHDRRSKPSRSTTSSGTHHSSRRRSHAADCLSLSLLPRLA